jgi:hypothetical protein
MTWGSSRPMFRSPPQSNAAPEGQRSSFATAHNLHISQAHPFIAAKKGKAITPAIAVMAARTNAWAGQWLQALNLLAAICVCSAHRRLPGTRRVAITPLAKAKPTVHSAFEAVLQVGSNSSIPPAQPHQQQLRSFTGSIPTSASCCSRPLLSMTLARFCQRCRTLRGILVCQTRAAMLLPGPRHHLHRQVEYSRSWPRIQARIHAAMQDVQLLSVPKPMRQPFVMTGCPWVVHWRKGTESCCGGRAHLPPVSWCTQVAQGHAPTLPF